MKTKITNNNEEGITGRKSKVYTLPPAIYDIEAYKQIPSRHRIAYTMNSSGAISNAHTRPSPTTIL